MWPYESNRIGGKCDFKKPAPQQFGLPLTIICYVAKNPTSPKLYQKLAGTCKYFYHKNPIIIVENIKFFEDCFYLCRDHKPKSYDLVIQKIGYYEEFVARKKQPKPKKRCFWYSNKFTCKFWVTKEAAFYTLNYYATKFLREKIFRINGLQFFVVGIVLPQVFPNPEVVQSVKRVLFFSMFPEYANGKPMPLEEVFEFFPNVEEFG